MPRFFNRVSRKSGLPPGTIIPVGAERMEKARITLFDFDEARFEEKVIERVEDLLPFKDKPTVTWVNVDGLEQVDALERIGKDFGLHPLVLEDIVHAGQRPKMEDFGDYIFIVLKMLRLDEGGDEVKAEQVSLVLGPNFVISFQEFPGDVFEPIRERIRQAKGRVRKMGSDYLAYTLLDAIVDNYFIILERFGERIEGLEDELVGNPTPETLQTIHILKREMIFLRRSVWPLRELVSGLQRAESPLIANTTGIYLRDVYDHTIQVMDTVESFRDMVSGMLDTYLSSLSNRMNEVMKVLTIIATIFIPITFIAGVYGMNFQFMPELGFHYAYFVALGVMAGVGVVMIVYFRRKGWL
jgi:magnesium transporter